MKLSIVILSAFLVGVISYLGPEAGRPHDHDRGCWRDGRVTIEYGDSTVGMLHSSPLEDRTLKELRSLETVVQKRIRDVESALRKIASSEAYLKRRMEDLGRDRHSFRKYKCRGEDEAFGSGEEAILKQLQALEEERLAFTGLLDRLESEQASLKVKIDLWGVKAKRALVEQFLGREERGPLDELRDDVRYGKSRKGEGEGIVY